MIVVRDRGCLLSQKTEELAGNYYSISFKGLWLQDMLHDPIEGIVSYLPRSPST
jgi:hypothetical protein